MDEIKCGSCKIIKNVNEYSKSGIKYKKCKQCKSEQDKKYAIKNKEKIAEYHHNLWRNNTERKKSNRLYVSKIRFGLDADNFVKGKSCEICGMTNQEHLDKWGERLNINHRNNKGRRAMKVGLKPDNNIDNLQVLCRACHCKYGNSKEQNYTGRGHKIWETRKQSMI